MTCQHQSFTCYECIPLTLIRIHSFSAAPINNHRILIAGTDARDEYRWKYSELTHERPLKPPERIADISRNCLEIVSATEVGHTQCWADYNPRALTCEFEGTSRSFHT